MSLFTKVPLLDTMTSSLKRFMTNNSSKQKQNKKYIYFFFLWLMFWIAKTKTLSFILFSSQLSTNIIFFFFFKKNSFFINFSWARIWQCLCVCVCVPNTLGQPKMVGFGWNFVHLFLGWIWEWFFHFSIIK